MRALGATLDARPDGGGRNVAYDVASPGADGLSPAARRHRLRELRDEPPAHRRDARRAADDRGPGWRCLIATPSGRSYHRATAPDGRGAPRSTSRFPPSPHRGRAHPAEGRGLRDAGAVGTGEVGDPARRPPGRGSDDGPGTGRHARPYGAHAEGPRRARRVARSATMAASPGRWKEGRRCRPSISTCRPMSRQRPSGSSRAPSTPMRSWSSGTSASTRLGGPSSTCLRAMGADIDERPSTHDG